MDDNASAKAKILQYTICGEIARTLDEAPQEDQGKILKLFLLGCIDTMREHSVFQLDLLEKLSFIALNNVQDVRLYSLEARMRELEKGKSITFGQVIGELFFALAVEAVILASVTYGAPVAAGSALLMASIKSSVRSKVTTVRTAVRRVQATRIVNARRREMRDALREHEGRLLSRLQGTPIPYSFRYYMEKQLPWRVSTGQEIERVRKWIADLDTSREFAIQEVAQQLNARTPQAADGVKLSPKLDKWVEDYAGHIGDSTKSGFRAFSQLARKDYSTVLLKGTESPNQPVENFTTTAATLGMTRECESLKLDVIFHHAQMRAILDAVDTDDIFDAFETLLVMEEVQNNLFDMIGLSDTMLGNLDGFVVPMELAVWLLYLEANNVLDREETASRRMITTGGYSPAKTRFIGDDFVTALLSSTGVPTDSPRTNYEGRRYPGLHVLDEHQSYYLFHKFAKPAFAQFAAKVPKSKTKELSDFIHRDVEARAFDEVLSMQKVFFFSGENEERRNLVKEMGVVVIEYFNFVREKVRQRDAFGFSDAVPEGTTIAELLDAIDKPTHAEMKPDAASPFTAEEWLAKQADLARAVWEERTLAVLAALDIAYDRAIAYYSHNLAMREKYKEEFSLEMFNDLFLSQAEAQLLSTRSAIEGQIEFIESDQAHGSDEVDARIDELKRKLLNSPVERQMRSFFPQ